MKRRPIMIRDPDSHHLAIQYAMVCAEPYTTPWRQKARLEQMEQIWARLGNRYGVRKAHELIQSARETWKMVEAV